VVLAEAGMTVENLSGSPPAWPAGRPGRELQGPRRFLAGHQPSMTIAIAGLWDESWLLEIDAIAVA